MTTLTKSDLRDSPRETAVDLIDRARAHLAVFATPISTSAGELKDPASARRGVQDAMTLLRRSAALLDEQEPRHDARHFRSLFVAILD